MKSRIRNILLVCLVVSVGVMLMPFIVVAKLIYEFNRLQIRMLKMNIIGVTQSKLRY